MRNIWPWNKPATHWKDESGRSEVWHAAMSGNVAALKRAFKSGDDPTAADNKGYTALHVAAQECQLEAVRLLIANGANVNAVDRDGNSPLWVAGYYAGRAIASDEAFKIVAALLKAGADPNLHNKAGKTPKFWATTSDRLRASYVSAGVDLSGA
jgi:uncharacterized protein